MDFSLQKNSTLKKAKEKGLFTFLIALFIAICLFVPYMFASEGYFTFYGDFNVQQIPFYKEGHKAVLDGNMFWNWHTDLGSNTIASYSYYLWGTPFFWLTLLFPNDFVPYLIGPLLILKFALVALTAYLYIRRFTRTPESASIGGLLYAFSGFSVYNIFFNQFHESIILFPLLLLSLELLITENKRFFFAITVFLCAVSNYFFFFGMVVFTVIYFFVRLFSGAIKIKFSRFLILVFEAVLGVLLAAALLLPTLITILEIPRVSSTLTGWNAIMYGKEQIYANILQCFFFPPDIPARPVFFPGAEVKWSSLGGWLPLFSMAGVFAFFSTKKKHWIKKILGICIFMALVPILNSMFYAFNTAYYARWFYMPILIMCLATSTMLEDSKANWSFGIKWVFGITLATSLVIGLFPKVTDDGKTVFGLFTQSEGYTLEEKDWTYIARYWTACIIAIASIIILWAIIKFSKAKPKTFYKISVSFVCIISIIYGNVFIFTGRSHSYDIKNIVIDSLIEGDVYLEEERDTYRIDTYDCVDNTAIFLGYSGINAFHSVVPASITNFYEYIGVERSVASRPDTDYYALRGLLSVKYLLNRKDGENFVDPETNQSAMYGYTYLKTESGYYIYENDYFVPYGFSYDYYMDYKMCDQFNDEAKANLMLKAILLDDKQIKKYSSLMENLYDATSRYDVSVTFGDEYYAEDCKKLAETSAYYFKTDNNGFTAKVKRDKENLVFFSVPYERGWSATVNGKPVEIEKVNVGFMAIKVPKGNSTIRFNYQTPLLKEGLLLTGSACFIFIAYIIVFVIYNRKHKPKNVYPEGDILLHEWLSQESEIKPEVKKQSILDDDPEINIPNINNGMEGGFKINQEFFENNE